MKLTQAQEKLAREIASKLNDMDSLQMHRKYVGIYSEEHLRKQLTKALSVKDEDVLVSRGALYNSLVKSNAGHSRN